MSGSAKSVINTGKVELRSLKFSSVSEARAEANRLAQAAREGRLVLRGNWSLGTIFGHLAFWIETIDDPSRVKVPWFMRLLGPMMRSKMTRGPLPRGTRIPGTPTGTMGDEPAELEGAVARLNRAFDRLERGSFPTRHPVFGTFTQGDWVALHLRHAELHLAFAEVRG